ncbi:F-box domain-containing protein [Mycena chlorophos]|uniref:F-box domain-containing protein n=1 Tax=Mycena chlorophos TaxID=658473 RepID=A0A8H6TEV3_MYCCL|nr:F-box domain-containing protein [Mycena chlorophos]
MTSHPTPSTPPPPEPISPYAHVLQTNYIPSDSECHTIRDFLSAPQTELADIQAEMKRLQTAFKALSVQRDRLRRFVRSHEALISPMRRMPPEILQMIFVYSLPRSRNCAISHKEGPMLLGRVCRAWRALVLATPRLWAAVHVVVPPASHVDALANWLKRVWLPRSGIRPLSISIANSGTLVTLENQPLRAIYDVVVAEAHRWADVELAFHTIEDLRYVADMLATSALPKLQVLKICSPVRQLLLLAEPAEDYLAFLGNAPAMRSLTLPDLQPIYSMLPPTLASIVNLKIEGTRLSRGLAYPHLWRVLRHCAALETADIICTTGDEFGHQNQNNATTSSTETETFSLPRLHTLTITHGRISTNTPHSAFFGPIDLPSLRTLACHTQGSWHSIGAAELTDLLPAAPSLVRVETLTLGISLLESGKLMRALRLFPALRKLGLLHEPKLPPGEAADGGGPGGMLGVILGADLPDGDGAFLEVLGRGLCPPPAAFSGTQEMPVEPLLPSLQHLYLHNLTATSDDALLAFVRTLVAGSSIASTDMLEDVANAALGLVPVPALGLRRLDCFFARVRQRDIRTELKQLLNPGPAEDGGNSNLEVQLHYSTRHEMSGYSPFAGLATRRAAVAA